MSNFVSIQCYLFFERSKDHFSFWCAPHPTVQPKFLSEILDLSLLVFEMEVGGDDGKKQVSSFSQIPMCYQLCLKMPQSVPKCPSREFLRGSKFKICGPSLCQKPSTTSRSSPLKSHSLATVSPVFYF